MNGTKIMYRWLRVDLAQNLSCNDPKFNKITLILLAIRVSFFFKYKNT